jgi:hypothetical protein
VQLASVPDLTGERAAELFASPDSAVAALTEEFRAVWRARSGDWSERPIGCLGLGSGAYVQWIGYSDRVLVEVSSNAYLDLPYQLDPVEEQRLIAYGFAAPDDESPNLAASIDHPGEAERLALRVVGMLTAVFAVYVG